MVVQLQQAGCTTLFANEARPTLHHSLRLGTNCVTSRIMHVGGNVSHLILTLFHLHSSCRI